MAEVARLLEGSMLGHAFGVWPAESMDWSDYCDSWHALVHIGSTPTYMGTVRAVVVTLSDRLQYHSGRMGVLVM